MCTSLVINKKKTLVGWNLDILNMEYRVRSCAEGVYIEINDRTEGWLPLFGANRRGDFVGMPTCWPFDARSNPTPGAENILLLDIDFLLQKRSLSETFELAQRKEISSIPGVSFMSQLSDGSGNVLQLIPGQGYRYFNRPDFAVLTNFSPFKGLSETHPWMGFDRYCTATQMLESAEDGFDVPDCFAILKAVSQTVCPTVVSMVYDVTERTVYWCTERRWDEISRVRFA